MNHSENPLTPTETGKAPVCCQVYPEPDGANVPHVPYDDDANIMQSSLKAG